MTQPVVCSSADTSARDILEKLNSSGFSGMPICEENIVLGIVSEKDIMQLLLQGKSLSSTFASEFMTRDVITADQNCYMLSVVKSFIDNQILRLPITDQGKLVGIITRHDLLKFILDATPEFSLVP